MLNLDSDLIGISSAYDKNTGKFFLVEDFYNNSTIVPYNDTAKSTDNEHGSDTITNYSN